MATMRQHSSVLLLIMWALLVGIVLPFEQNGIAYTLCSKESPTSVEMTPVSPGILLLSPNFGDGHYPNNLSCYIRLYSRNEAVGLKLHFRTFVVESGKREDCIYDFLCIDGIFFCGSNLGDYVFLHIIPANSVFTIVFQTDGDGTGDGFDIAVTPVPVEHGSIVTQSESSNKNLTKTRDPSRHYIDGCGFWVNRRRLTINPTVEPTKPPHVAKCSCHCESDLYHGDD
ncbi:unnamed protein product [Candidula unifasciata]|uniref:CUB domain-containing protein n=1 Tax=Candidula unifasciata TaxID=100452 RepID=A0A8S3ZL86_9EUPU|nr:unnamed protein product [Candidula unifasciata]